MMRGFVAKDIIEVTCSCGLTNTAIFDRRKQVYVCSGWEFRKSNAQKLPLGWYCGKKGHYQLDEA